MLSILLPIYARQLGASATAIGGLFSVFTGVLLIVRPLTGWALGLGSLKRDPKGRQNGITNMSKSLHRKWGADGLRAEGPRAQGLRDHRVRASL